MAIVSPSEDHGAVFIYAPCQITLLCLERWMIAWGITQCVSGANGAHARSEERDTCDFPGVGGVVTGALFFCYLPILMGFPLFQHTKVSSIVKTNPSIFLTYRCRGVMLLHQDGFMRMLGSKNFGVSGSPACPMSSTGIGLCSVTSVPTLQVLTNPSLLEYSK